MYAAPDVGELVYDTTQDRVGEVMDYQGGRAVLRPSGGGIEWEAAPQELRPADAYDRLRARVNELNARRF